MKFSEWLINEEITLTPLYRGIAGDYRNNVGEIQHFAGDIDTAIRYANTEAKKKGLQPNVLVMKVPSRTMDSYRTVGGQDEIYDIPTKIADRFPKQVLSIAQASQIAQQYQSTLDGTNNRTVPVMFKNQGPEGNGWTITFHPMGQPNQLNKAFVKSVRDVADTRMLNPALLQRVSKLGEVPLMVISDKGNFLTTMPQQAAMVAKRKAGLISV